MLLVLPLWLTGCAVMQPFALAPSTGPLPDQFDIVGNVSSEKCRTLLFGFIPLSEDFGMQDLIDDATGKNDSLIQITIDRTTTNAFIMTSDCYTLSALAVKYERRKKDAARVASESTAGTSDEMPSTAFRATEMVYAAVGRKRPSDPAAYIEDARVVWSYAVGGKDVTDIVRAAERGVNTVGKDAAISAILEAGFAAKATKTFDDDE